MIHQLTIRCSALEEGRWEIQIEDNGTGFDQKYAYRIFKPFERLHGRSEYEGTGMGLAVCKKIVERHHGQISAESEKDKGTIFKVVLPECQ
ncbi:MAG: ATP-binding protein [Nitrospinaceae bacterium]|jgi:signal transduction histidine kinase|nr:ATP-binding protein [Nitrospinaceae bacterium]